MGVRGIIEGKSIYLAIFGRSVRWESGARFVACSPHRTPSRHSLMPWGTDRASYGSGRTTIECMCMFFQ